MIAQRVVGAAVVDVDYRRRDVRHSCECRAQPLEEIGQVFLLVVDRDNDGQRLRFGHSIEFVEYPSFIKI